MKKKIIFFIILYLFMFSYFFSYADDITAEDDFIDNEVFKSVEVYTNDLSAEPVINARHAVIFDRSSKKSIYGKKEKEICKMASTTKIMTAIVVLENANLNDLVKISSKSAHTGGSRLGLSTNDTITVENLLYGLLLKSRK